MLASALLNEVPPPVNYGNRIPLKHAEKHFLHGSGSLVRETLIPQLAPPEKLNATFSVGLRY